MVNLGEHDPTQEDPEEEERYRQWMEDHPEPKLPQERLTESGPKIAQFEMLVSSFEATYSLAELHAIVDLRPEDAANYPLREAAKEALVPIFETLKSLNGVAISQEKL